MSAKKSYFRQMFGPVAAVVIAIVLLSGVNVVITALPSPGYVVGVVDDWSNHHIAFRNEGSAADALAGGRLERWYKNVGNERYIMQGMRRNPLSRAVLSAPDFASRMALLNPPVDFAPIGKSTPSRVVIKADWNIDVGPKGVGPGQFPAKYSFNGAQSASDLLVLNTNETGSTTSAQIMGINALYTTPVVVFAYYNSSDTADVANSSVIFDGLGDQVAYITVNASHAYLNVLRFETTSGNGTAYGAAVAITPSASAAAFTTCKAGSGACLYRVEFANAANNTNSAPFYDYHDDLLYVGDNSGDVHEFTGVFLGTVAESGNPWATTGTTAPEAILTGPVYDGTNVYVGCNNGKAYLIPVATPGTVTASEQLTSTETGYIGINDAPLLDASGGNLFFSVASDAINSGSGNVRVPTGTTTAFNSDYYAIDYTALRTAAWKDIPSYVGSFDNVYYTSGATATTGYLTDCNIYGGGGLYFDPQLIDNYKTLNGNFTYVPNYMAVSASSIACSPQTEVFNGTNDYAFFSVASAPSTTGTSPACQSADGCIYGLIIGSSTAFTFTGTTHTANADYYAPTNAAGSTSGLVVDNAGSGTNHVYYTTNGTGGTPGSPTCTTTAGNCATQLLQTTLR